METAENSIPVVTGSSSLPSADQATSSTDNAPARASLPEREEPQEEQQQERNSSELIQRTQTDVRDTSQSIPPSNPQSPNVTSAPRDGPEEDLSTPTGEELKEMEAMANSHSALDCRNSNLKITVISYVPVLTSYAVKMTIGRNLSSWNLAMTPNFPPSKRVV